MTQRLRRHLPAQIGADRGASLVEILVSMLLLSVIMSITVATFIRTNRATQRTEDEADGLGDIRVVSERLSKDVLAARSVDPDPLKSNASKLTLWIDYNSDYVQSAVETITWALVTGSTPGHFDVIRSTGTGVSQTQGRTLVNAIAFSYDGAATASVTTKTVTVTMTYDATINGGASQRQVKFIARLRNVE